MKKIMIIAFVFVAFTNAFANEKIKFGSVTLGINDDSKKFSDFTYADVKGRMMVNKDDKEINQYIGFMFNEAMTNVDTFLTVIETIEKDYNVEMDFVDGIGYEAKTNGYYITVNERSIMIVPINQ